MKPHFLDLHLSVSDGFVSSKLYEKRDEFDSDMGNFPFSVGGYRDEPGVRPFVRFLSVLKLENRMF